MDELVIWKIDGEFSGNYYPLSSKLDNYVLQIENQSRWQVYDVEGEFRRYICLGEKE